MELLKFTIAANETKVFERAGRYLEIIDSTAEVEISLYDRNGGNTDDATGALSGLYLEGEFSAFTIKSATAQTITLLITDGRGGSRRQPGNVRVIDQGADKSLGGTQFICSMTGVDPACRILTLRATSKNVYVKRLVITASVSGTVAIGTGNGTPTSGYVLQGTARNKNYAAGVSTANREVATAAAQTPTTGEVPGYAGLITILVTANTPVEIPLTTPLVLVPGSLLIVTAPAAGATINYMADFEE